MKRNLFFILCILLCGFAFANGTSEDAATAGYETTFWCDSPQLEEALVASTEAFMKENPQYTIHVEAFPGSERPDKLALAKEGGTLPSLFFIGYFTALDEIHQGTILPVTDIINSNYADLVSDSVLSEVEINGDYYMVPVYTSPQGFLYNADIFRAAGLEDYISDSEYEIICWTLDDLDQVILPTLKKYFEGTNKYPLALFAANEQNDTYMMNLLKIYDGNIFADNKVCAGDDENVIKALTKLKEWYDNGYTNFDVTTRIWTDCNGDFRNQLVGVSAGQFATYLGHTDAFAAGTAEPFDIRVAAVPAVAADGSNKGYMNTFKYGFVLMNVDETQQEIAREYLKWYSEHAPEYVINSGLPAISTVYEALRADNPMFDAYKEAEKYSYDFTCGVPGFVAARSCFYPELQNAFSGTKTPAEALADYQKNANDVIQEYLDYSVVLNK